LQAGYSEDFLHVSHASAQSPDSGLAGKRILVTRPAEPAELARAGQEHVSGASDELSRLLIGWGAQVQHLPLVSIQSIPFRLSPQTHYDWLFFTSKNAVRSFYAPGNPVQTSHPKIAVVGPATAQCVRELDYPVDFVAPKYDAESAATAFSQTMPCAGLSVLWPCGNLANPALQTILQSAGAKVHPLVVYQTSLKAKLNPQEQELLIPPPDMLVFTSSSAVEAWCNLSPSSPLDSTSLQAVPVACLGSKTAQSALQHLGRANVQANPHTLPALAQAIFDYFQEETAP
jgi:uroporphyrinogen-III synthase